MVQFFCRLVLEDSYIYRISVVMSIGSTMLHSTGQILIQQNLSVLYFKWWCNSIEIHIMHGWL